MRRLISLALPILPLLIPLMAQEAKRYDYRVLATSKTSTMEKEMNEAADAGYNFGGVMGGDTAAGGKEVVVIMSKDSDAKGEGQRKYKLLATSRTGTMQKELQQAGDEGYEFQGSTVFQSALGGGEVSVILEKSTGSRHQRRQSPAEAFAEVAELGLPKRLAGGRGRARDQRVLDIDLEQALAEQAETAVDLPTTTPHKR